MSDGLVFIWVPKGKCLSDTIKVFVNKDFYYVENVCFVMLDETKKSGK